MVVALRCLIDVWDGAIIFMTIYYITNMLVHIIVQAASVVMFGLGVQLT